MAWGSWLTRERLNVCIDIIIISSVSLSRLRFLNIRWSGLVKDSLGRAQKVTSAYYLSFIYKLQSTFSAYTTDIKEDTIVCTPIYPVSEATGPQLVIAIIIIHS